MQKLLDSDWLREVQFKCNTSTSISNHMSRVKLRINITREQGQFLQFLKTRDYLFMT